MTTENEKAVRALPCPFCGGEVDPEGWLDGSGGRGPECEECGATAESLEAWNRRAAAPKAPQQVSNTPKNGEVPGGIYVELERGALQLAINVLRRAGKSEVADELVKACRAIELQQQEQSGEAVALPFAILDEEMEALRRFHECVTDGEGYDVPKPMMKRLAEIGLLRHVSAGYYEQTIFGLAVLNGDFSPATPTATASQESAPGQEAVRFIDVWKKYMPAPMPEEMQTYRWCETFWKEGRKSIAPPTSTAAMVIKQARAIVSKALLESRYMPTVCRVIDNALASLSPANAEAELEALMKDGQEMRSVITEVAPFALAAIGADITKQEARHLPQDHNIAAFIEIDRLRGIASRLRAIVRRVLDEAKGE